MLAKITQDKAENTTVHIPNKEGTNNYTLIVMSTEQTANITQYLREDFEYTPHHNDNIMSTTGIVPTITVNNYPYTASVGYWGQQSNDSPIGSDLPYRLIAPGQTDVISAILPARFIMQDDVDAMGADIRNPTSITTLIARSFIPTKDVELTYGGNQSFTIRYVFRPMGLNGVRLAWINKYGALEFWNFDKLREQNFVASSDSIYTHKGYKKLNTKAEKHYTIETRELTREALDALSYIVASPAVWLVNDEGDGIDDSSFEAIDIITDECKVYSDNELLALQVTYRPQMREL